MAENKKMVEAITAMEEDFGKWYTDVVKKADLIDYSSVKGCMIIRPYGYAIWENMQRILDKMCEQELYAERRENDNLRTQLNMATLNASQTRQTADIQNSIISELRSCPIPSQPVYGNQPIFTCPNNNSGCGCNGNFYN